MRWGIEKLRLISLRGGLVYFNPSLLCIITSQHPSSTKYPFTFSSCFLSSQLPYSPFVWQLPQHLLFCLSIFVSLTLQTKPFFSVWVFNGMFGSFMDVRSLKKSRLFEWEKVPQTIFFSRGLHLMEEQRVEFGSIFKRSEKPQIWWDCSMTDFRLGRTWSRATQTKKDIIQMKMKMKMKKNKMLN